MKTSKFDLISIVGIITACAAIVGGQILEGGSARSLIQFTAFCIVIGGTMGAIMLQTSLPAFILGFRLIKWVFKPPKYDPVSFIKDIVSWSSLARKEGLLRLETEIQSYEDPFIRKGLQMLVDGFDAKDIQKELEIEITSKEQHQLRAAKIWEAAGGYSPTIGILGAVLGLIHVMENLSEPSKLGGGIAVAFVATVYGVGSANLLFLPIANKLKTIIAQEATLREMMIEGFCAVSNGENPRIIETKLLGFIV